MIGARPLDDNEVEQLLTKGFTGQFKHRNRSFFALGVSTGFRAGELLSLLMRDVMKRKYPRKYVKVRRKNTKGKTQGRTQVIHTFAQQALQPWIDQRLDGTSLADLLDQPVFISRETDTRTGQIKPITIHMAGMMLNQAFSRCGIEGNVSTHSMRKTFAEKVYYDAVKKFKSGQILKEPMRVVQDQLGHKSIASTEKYLSFIGSDTDPDLFDFRANL